ncbi:TetR/AcrR family transcriptional regulator [Kitasatospora sp. NPDC052896]|uniref:TetR/AcrR family transcriptional regulator n=1 Tax=Kitasatospora sp. NPDC052896 TaxID=3364061 RepID=UPI0037C82566
MEQSEATTHQSTSSRGDQKLRTRTAILRAAAELMRTGRGVTMPEVARAALVSEATAYRYFPDLASLLQEAMTGQWPTPERALAAVTDSRDPVERIAAATEHLLRLVLTYQGATRTMIAATITRPGATSARPALRLGLVDHALAPLAETLGATDPAALARLKHDLAIVISAEALFTLTDLCGLDPDAAIASAVRTATTLTRAALREDATVRPAEATKRRLADDCPGRPSPASVPTRSTGG